MIDLGKEFEARFKLDWTRTFPNGTITRLYDVTSGYKSMSTISDFICYNYPYQFFIECKTHKGASLPFSVITQYDKLTDVVGVPGVRSGVIVWLYEKDIVFYVPTSTITEMKSYNEKSIGIRHFNSNYKIIHIPAKKLVRYMQCDLSCLMNLHDGD